MWQFLALTSAGFSALAAIAEKKALQTIKPIGFSLVLSFFIFVLTIPFLFFVNYSLVTTNAILVLYAKSVMGAVAFLLVMYGLKYIDISKSLPLLVLTPALVAILAFYFLDEDIGYWGIIGMFLLLVGTYFLQLDHKSNWLSPFFFVKQNRAFLYIIGALLLFTATSILDKTLLKSFKLQPEAFLPLQQLFFTLNFILVFIFSKETKSKLKIELGKTWKLIVLIAVFAVIYRYSHILAVKAGSVALVLSIKRTSVFFATVFGGRYFKERNLLQRSIAVAIMIAGAVIIILMP